MQGSLGIVTELEGDGLTALSLDALRRIVQYIAFPSSDFLDYQSGVGINALNQDGASAIRNELTVAVTNDAAITLRDQELHIGQRLASHSIDLLDEYAALRLVPEGDGDDILILTAQVHGLDIILTEHVTVRSRDLLHNVGACLQAGQDESTVGAGLTLSDGGTASTGGAAQESDTEPCALQRITSIGIHLLHHDGAQGRILKCHNLTATGFHIEFLGCRVLNGITRSTLQLSDGVPAVIQLVQLELAILIGIESTQVPDLTGTGLIGLESDAELGPLNGIAGDAVDLIDGQCRLRVVLKLHGTRSVGEQSDQLMLLIEQVAIGYGLLPDLIDTGHQLLQEAAAILIGSHGSQRGGIHTLDSECDACDRLAGDCVCLQDLQVGHTIVGDYQLTGLAGEQFHMVLTQILHIAFRCIHLNDGVDAGLQIGDVDFTVGVGDAIEVMSAILNLRNAEGCSGQALAIEAIQLDQAEAGHAGIGKDELCILITIDLNDTSGVINQVAFRCFQLSDLICTGLQGGQVNLTILIGHIFLGEGATHMLNAESRIGLRLQCSAIQLHQMDAGLLVIEENQLQNTVRALQLNLLRIGIDDMLGVRCNFLCNIGTGLQISQQDLSELIGLEDAQRLGVAEDLERDVRQGLLILGVVLDDSQAGLLLIDDGHLHSVSGEHSCGIDRIIHDVACRCSDLLDSVCTGLNFIEDGHARVVGLTSVGGTRLNVLDLHHCAGELHAGVRVLPDHQSAVRCILKSQSCLLAEFHSDILCGLLTQQVPVRCLALVDGIVARQSQRDHDLALGVGCECTNSSALGIHHFKHSALQGDGSAFLILDDLQAGLGRLFFRGVGIVTVSGQAQRCGGVGIHHVVLQLTVLIHLSTHGIVDGVLIDIGTKAHLHAAGLTLHAANGIQDLELTGVTITSGLGGDHVDLLVIHIHDLSACRYSGRISESNVNGIVTDPGLGSDGKDLLQVFLAIDGHRIRNFLIGLRGDIGSQNLGPCGAATVDVLHGCQHLIGSLQLHAGQVGIDLHVVDIPVGQQIRPECHLGGVVGLILILKLQLAKASMRIAICDDTNDFGIASDLLSQVLDALPFRDGLRHALSVGIDTVRRDLLRLAIAVDVVVVRIDELANSAIDGKIAQRSATIVDVHFTKRFLHGTCSEGGSGDHAENHDDGEQHTHYACFHDILFLHFDFVYHMKLLELR